MCKWLFLEEEIYHTSEEVRVRMTSITGKGPKEKATSRTMTFFNETNRSKIRSWRL
jgi:hypothetical protein